MRVRLIAFTKVVDNIPGYQPNERALFPTAYSDDLVEQAGRLCYLSWSRPNPATATNQGYVANIIKQGHFSVMEHASATLYVDGVTRNFTHEFIRHRHFSYSEVSQRYVDASAFEFVDHPGLNSINPSERARLEKSVRNSFDVYGSLVHNLTEQGNGRKQARQAARHALPSGTETKILITGNMRTWREMLWKRLATDEYGDPLADLEFYTVAKQMLNILKSVAPNTFQDFDNIRLLT